MDSFQSEIPKSRVSITLDLHTGGAQKKVELPLKLLVAGDFSAGKEQAPLAERKKTNIDKNNFDAVLSDLAPELKVAAANTLADNGSELPVSLKHLQRGNIAPVDLAQAAIGPSAACIPTCCGWGSTPSVVEIQQMWCS